MQQDSNVTLTTNAGTDTLTIAATAGANTIAIDTYTGNGSTAAYTLSNSASSENELLVYFRWCLISYTRNLIQYQVQL